MKAFVVASILSLLVQGCAGMEVLTNGLIVADWAQTLEIADDPNYYETNPILGKYPTEGEVNTYFASYLIVNTVLNRTLKGHWLTAYQCYIVVEQAGAVSNNYSVGIRGRLP